MINAERTVTKKELINEFVKLEGEDRFTSNYNLAHKMVQRMFPSFSESKTACWARCKLLAHRASLSEGNIRENVINQKLDR